MKSITTNNTKTIRRQKTKNQILIKLKKSIMKLSTKKFAEFLNINGIDTITKPTRLLSEGVEFINEYQLHEILGSHWNCLYQNAIDFCREFELIVKAKTIKSTSFVGVREYTNKFNEVSNQTFVAGISYSNLLNADLEKLTSNEVKKQVVALYNESGKELVKKAYNELVTSLVKRTSSEVEKDKLRVENDKTIKQSDGQIEAYKTLAKGVKVHREKGLLYVFGLLVRKTKLVDGVYPAVKTQKKTLVKNAIKVIADQRQAKYRMFSLGQADQINIQGVTV